MMRALVWLLTLLSVVLVTWSWWVDGTPGKAVAAAGVLCASAVILAFVWAHLSRLSRRGGERR